MHASTNQQPPRPSSSSWLVVKREARWLEERPGSPLAVLAAITATVLFWVLFVA